jgi:hypothetical protein
VAVLWLNWMDLIDLPAITLYRIGWLQIIQFDTS